MTSVVRYDKLTFSLKFARKQYSMRILSIVIGVPSIVGVVFFAMQELLWHRDIDLVAFLCFAFGILVAVQIFSTSNITNTIRDAKNSIKDSIQDAKDSILDKLPK